MILNLQKQRKQIVSLIKAKNSREKKQNQNKTKKQTNWLINTIHSIWVAFDTHFKIKLNITINDGLVAAACVKHFTTSLVFRTALNVWTTSWGLCPSCLAHQFLVAEWAGQSYAHRGKCFFTNLIWNKLPCPSNNSFG